MDNFRTKYIVVLLDGDPYPFIFSEILNHREIAMKLTGIPDPNVLGAGFCYIQNDSFHCFGKSTSLEVQSRGVLDDKILNKHLIGA